jgi:hypothetical protein
VAHERLGEVGWWADPSKVILRLTLLCQIAGDSGSHGFDPSAKVQPAFKFRRIQLLQSREPRRRASSKARTANLRRDSARRS